MPSQVVEGFGGLNLQNDPGENGGAIDCTNVLPLRSGRGGVKVRNGYNTFSTANSAGAGQAMAAFVSSGSTRQLLVSGGLTDAHAINTAGTLVRAASSDAVGRAVYSFASIGTTSGTFAYGGSYEGGTMLRWDGTTWSAIAGSPQAAFVAVQPAENRLVAARVFGQVHRVQFSDAGAPETWGANNYVDLHPGDGQSIEAVVVWRELLFVFKQTKFFVFYGNSTDSTGNPVFNYRTVDTGKGVGPTGAVGRKRAVAAPEGVYFFGADGIYLTNGGPPVRVSEPIDSFFRGDQDAQTDYLGVSLDLTTASPGVYRNLVYHENRLWASCTTASYSLGGNSYTEGVLVYDPRAEWWGFLGGGDTAHPLRFASAATFPATSASSEDLFFVAATGEVQRYGSTNQNYTTDRGDAIVSRYRSAFADFGNGVEKEIMETKLWGTGTVNFAWSSDYGSLDSTTSVTLGSSPAIAQGRHSVSKLGELFSYQVSASSGAWTLNRLVPILARGGADQADRP